MNVWQADLFRLLSSIDGDILWILLICNSEKELVYQAQSSQSEVNSKWLINQLEKAIQNNPPDKIEIFRPQIVGLFSIATKALNISLETTRRTGAIKEKVRQYLLGESLETLSKNYLGLDKPPPQNVPENVWGENWSFVSILSEEIQKFTQERPLLFCDLPESLLATNSRLNPTTKVPGIVIYGGKKSLTLGRWLSEKQPVSLNYIPTEIGKSGGLILESGLVDRWILATFESETVATAAKAYEQAKQESLGLHFLILQPDDSGMTYTGFWLLKNEE